MVIKIDIVLFVSEIIRLNVGDVCTRSGLSSCLQVTCPVIIERFESHLGLRILNVGRPFSERRGGQGTTQMSACA